jgi:hypothetical protein
VIARRREKKTRSSDMKHFQVVPSFLIMPVITCALLLLMLQPPASEAQLDINVG